MGESSEHRQKLASVFKNREYDDFKWIAPDKIVVSQWVRMKCMYGCPGYGKHACCPPNVPSVSESERFFREYTEAVIFRFAKKFDDPEERHDWTKKIDAGLIKLEREVFLSGHERAFLLVPDCCALCADCSATRENCEHPKLSRPTAEALAIDVYTTVRSVGFPIQVLADKSQEMNRYAFLMIR